MEAPLDRGIFILAGFVSSSRVKDVFVYTPLVAVSSSPVDGNKMYLYGGYSGSQRLRDMHAYDLETHVWSPVEGNFGDMPSGRSSLVAQVHENHVVRQSLFCVFILFPVV